MRKPRKAAEKLAFRFPFSPVQRADIGPCDIRPGAAADHLTSDSLVVSGTWAQKDALTITPVFAGSLRFLAADPRQLPKPDQVIIDNGHVKDTYLRTLGALPGTMLVRVQNSGLMTQMKEKGAIPVVGMAPTHAFYGPVVLGEAFLRSTVLNPVLLEPAIVEDAAGKKVSPGTAAWEALVLCRFLAGDYQLILHAGAELVDDDAGKLPMPSVVVNGGTFSIGMTFGWPKRDRVEPDGPTSLALETVPADVFLRHLAPEMRETGVPPAVNDPVLTAVLKGEYSAEPWATRLKASLAALGFGAKDGSSPIELMLREFQFAAAARFIAKPVNQGASPAQLSLRDFRHLEQVANLDIYDGAFSGFANRRTRTLIAAWTDSGFRNPLLMPVFMGDEKRFVPPVGDPVAGAEDVWHRSEMTLGLGRVFAADFTRYDLVGGRIAHADLRPVGRYKGHGAPNGGPVTSNPVSGVRVATAEIKPDIMFGVAEAPLIAALADRTKADPALVDKASSFRVVRAVSEVESLGYLDIINAYDGAGISLAPYHWAMAGTEKSPGETSELGGFAAVCAAGVARGAWRDDVFRARGLAAIGKGRAAGFGKFVAVLGFLDDRGEPRTMVTPEGPDAVMPSWRSVYRWRRAGQSEQDYGRSAWAFALLRLATVFNTPMGMPVAGTDKRWHPKSGATIGSVFTSELLMAMIVRWHVKAPSGVVRGDGKAADSITEAYRVAARAVTGADPHLWEAQLKTALLATLVTFIRENPEHGELTDHMGKLAVPGWIDQSPQIPVIKTGEGQNEYGFTLDPRLRLLEGPFSLATS